MRIRLCKIIFNNFLQLTNNTMINRNLTFFCITVSCLITGVLTFFPQIDIGFSELFYDQKYRFIYRKNELVEFLFISVPILTKYFLIIISLILSYQIFLYRNFKKIIRSYVVYLLIAAAIGPGFIVNYVFKENFNRARPSQIEYFKGSKVFSQAFVISDQCDTNCSFSSGHAAMAYYFTAIAYALVIARKDSLRNNNLNQDFTLLYSTGILFGTLVGLSRILMGRHFLSDVAASCAIVLIINHLLYECWKKMK